VSPVITLQAYKARTLEFRALADVKKTLPFLSRIGKHKPVRILPMGFITFEKIKVLKKEAQKLINFILLLKLKKIRKGSDPFLSSNHLHG